MNDRAGSRVAAWEGMVEGRTRRGICPSRGTASPPLARATQHCPSPIGGQYRLGTAAWGIVPRGTDCRVAPLGPLVQFPSKSSPEATPDFANRRWVVVGRRPGWQSVAPQMGGGGGTVPRTHIRRRPSVGTHSRPVSHHCLPTDTVRESPTRKEQDKHDHDRRARGRCSGGAADGGTGMGGAHVSVEAVVTAQSSLVRPLAHAIFCLSGACTGRRLE